jgi:hypothetical protein
MKALTKTALLPEDFHYFISHLGGGRSGRGADIVQAQGLWLIALSRKFLTLFDEHVVLSRLMLFESWCQQMAIQIYLNMTNKSRRG